MTQALTIPDGLTLIRANVWNAVQYIKQTIFTSSGINSWTKLMDINANSGYVWINHQLLNTWISFNWKFLSLNQNGYLIYSDVPFSSGAQSSGDIYVNGISFDSWTNILTLHMHWGWTVTWLLEGIEWPQWPTWFLQNWVLWDTPYRNGNEWITDNPYIFNLWTGTVWIGPNWSWDNFPTVCNRGKNIGLDINWMLRIRQIPDVTDFDNFLVIYNALDSKECDHTGHLVRKFSKSKFIEITQEIVQNVVNTSYILSNLPECNPWQILQYWKGRECVNPCCLSDVNYNSGTNQLTLTTQNGQVFTGIIDTWRKKDNNDNYIYNYNNDDYKVHIWPNKGNPEAQLEIKTDSTKYNNWYNLLLKTYDKGDKNDRFAWLFFGVNENPWYKAAITFMRDNYGNNKKYGLGELRFSLDHDDENHYFNTGQLTTHNSNFHIMRMRHLYDNDNKTRKWAVWINTELTITWVALDINDTMRLEPRNEEPFRCEERTIWSIFMYINTSKPPTLIYPCFCGNVNVDSNEYNRYAIWRWNNKLCTEY